MEAQRQYLEEQEYLRQNKDNFDRMIKEEQEAMAKQMPSTFWGAASAMLGGPPPPPGQSESGVAEGAPAGAPGQSASAAALSAAAPSSK